MCNCVHVCAMIIKYYIAILLCRVSPWLLAVTLVGLTQVSHDLLKEEGVASRILSLNGDHQGIIDKLQSKKYVVNYRGY